MRRASESDTERLAGQLEAAAVLLREAAECKCTKPRKNEEGVWVNVPACKSKLTHALRVARQSAGFVKASGGGPNHGGDVPNPTLAAVVGRDGGVSDRLGPEWWEHRISRDTALVSAALSDLIVLVAELGKVTKTKPGDLTKNGQGTCPACDHFCSGALRDRLVSGMCDTDYRAWVRAGRPDRSVWIQQRRRDRVSNGAA